MLRHFSLGIVLLFGISSQAEAITVINFLSGLSFSPIKIADKTSGVIDTKFDNLSIIGSSSSSSATGSGSSSAYLENNVTSFGGQVTAFLQGPGVGSAAASISSTFSYDLLFPRPGRYLIPAELDAIGIIETQAGDNGFANLSIFADFPTIPMKIGTHFECNTVCSLSNINGNSFDLSVDIGRDLRLPVVSSLNFNIRVSRAIAVSEPSMLFFILFVFLVLGFANGQLTGFRRSPLTPQYR